MKSNQTKKALAEALKQLLTRKPINKITINDITEQCGISRMTFYYHFKDIYDLAEWTLEEATQQIIGENRYADNWQQGFLDLLKEVKENQKLYMNVYRSMDREAIERYLLKKVEPLLMPVVEKEAAGMGISPEGKRVVAIFYTYAFIGVVLDWISKGMPLTPQQVVTLTAAVVQGDFRNSLHNLKNLDISRYNA
jgi:probable dihydroxyacetone kinase regulator